MISKFSPAANSKYKAQETKYVIIFHFLYNLSTNYEMAKINRMVYNNH